MRAVAAEEKRWRDTDGLHSPEQKQTGSNGARAPSPLHSSCQRQLGGKNPNQNMFTSKSFPSNTGK